jgi:hypothetical protein
MATRYTANTTETTNLNFQFYKNGAKADAFAIIRVIVYKTNADAIADTNPHNTIESTSITRTDVGLYNYTVPIITSTGTYYDKMYIVPVDGSPSYSFINSFTVSSFSGTPSSTLPLCLVSGFIANGAGIPYANAKLNFIVDVIPAVENSTHTGIVPESVYCTTSSTGFFSIYLVKLFIYRVDIKCMGFHETIQVPNATAIDLWSLTATPILDVTTPVNPGPGGNW